MSTIGREVFAINPSPKNPRNTEGAFVVLNDGTIMFAYTRFIGESDDDGDAELYAIFSHDDGETWGEGRTIMRKAPGDLNIMSVSFLRMNDGALGMFYLRKTKTNDQINCLVNLVRSYDEGKTWSEPQQCMENGYYVLNNDRVVRLKNGRVIIPTAFHRGGVERAVSCFFISDDDCKTFHKAKDSLELPFSHKFTGMQETGVAELKDGRIWGWARTGHGYQFEAYSEDQGETWSDVNPNEFFTSPNSPMSVKWLQNDKMLAIFNPIPYYNGRYVLGDPKAPHAKFEPCRFDMYHPFSVYEGRTPLACALSAGTPKEFEPDLYYLEDNPERGFCYTSILPHKDFVLTAYFVVGEDYGYKDLGMNVYGIKIKKVHISEFEKK